MPPLQMVSSEQFATLRRYFAQSDFTSDAIHRRLNVPESRELDLAALSSATPLRLKAEDGLDALIYLFVAGLSLPVADTVSLFTTAVWDALSQTHLVLPDPTDADRCFATVALYPIRDLFIASDRWNNPDRSPRQKFDDIVYPALSKSAKQFIDFTSFAACDDFLELCAGTAPAALLASRSAKNVWATDIAERSIQFAKFNAALNDIHNVTIALGDLYQPVGDRTFDRIAAHPPYVPVLKPAEIFYGGGEVGEEITERIIRELPARLKPGGRLYCRTMGTERPGQSLEQRIRGWLGEKHLEFDVALFAVTTLQPRQFALEETIGRNGGRDQMAQWERLFTKNEVREFVIGIVIVQRCAERRPSFTVRRTISSDTPAAVLEWTMRWETELQMAGTIDQFLQAKLLATPGTQIIVRHTMRDGEISPDNFTLSVEAPFAMDCKVQPWMVLLLPRCDGKTTVAELFAVAKQNGWIVPETPAEEFSRLLATFVSGGFLQTEDFRLPAAAG